MNKKNERNKRNKRNKKEEAGWTNKGGDEGAMWEGAYRVRDLRRGLSLGLRGKIYITRTCIIGLERGGRRSGRGRGRGRERG